MTEIHLNLNNFLDFKALLSLFPESNQYEFTPKKIFRRKTYVICSCGCEMRHNGYDFVRKNGFGKAKVGKQLCPVCGKQHHEDKGFWKNLLSEWVKTITSLIMTLRTSDVAWEVVSNIMRFIVPCSKDKARYLFNNKIEQFEKHFIKLARVHYTRRTQKLPWDELAVELKGMKQALVVLNSRKDALRLLEEMKEMGNVFHLSTLLCGKRW